MSKRKISGFGASYLLIGVLSGCSSSAPPPVMPLTTTPMTAGSGGLQGTVSIQPNCMYGGAQQTTAQVGIYSGSTPVYSNGVSNGGSYQYHLQLGSCTGGTMQSMTQSFTIVGYTAGGLCCGYQTVSVMPSQMSQVPLTLSPGGCPQQVLYALSSYPQYTTTGYGNTVPGCNGTAFGNPNLYLSGPAGTKFKVKLNYPGDANIFSSSPIYYNEGWNGEIIAVNSPSQPNIQVEKAVYNYLRYDIRTATEILQDQNVFCVPQADLISSMANYLEQAQFRDAEIEEFKKTFEKGYPKADQYCVFPQEGSALESMVGLDITPKPKKVTRVWFFVVPQANTPAAAPSGTPAPAESAAPVEVAALRLGKFVGKKTNEVLVAKITRSASRAIASVATPPGNPSDFEAREWAIGYVLDPSKAPKPSGPSLGAMLNPGAPAPAAPGAPGNPPAGGPPPGAPTGAAPAPNTAAPAAK